MISAPGMAGQSVKGCETGMVLSDDGGQDDRARTGLSERRDDGQFPGGGLPAVFVEIRDGVTEYGRCIGRKHYGCILRGAASENADFGCRRERSEGVQQEKQEREDRQFCSGHWFFDMILSKVRCRKRLVRCAI